MTLQEKRRVLARWDYQRQRRLYNTLDANKLVLDSSGTDTIYSMQVTRSEGHPWPRGKGVQDVGGPFDTVKLLYKPTGHDRVVYERMNGQYLETNKSDPLPRGAGIPAPFQNSSGSLEYYAQWVHNGSGAALGPIGASFINQTIPTNPVVDGAVSLAELYREGLPTLIGASLKLRDTSSFFRSLGGEYLNYQFGWLPLVSDLKSAAKAIMESERILSQLARDSGKNVHRKRISEPIRTTSVYTDSANHYNGMGGADVLAPPWYRETDSTSIQRWFTGCYTYHFEPARMDALQEIVVKARLLYGLDLNPEVLWNLAPWSWFIDWFANVGPLLGNVSAFQKDGLVLRYGYVMEETTRTLQRRNQIRPKYGPWPMASQDTFQGIRKRREKANPFGFGLTESQLSTRQWSILAALGMTKTPRSLPKY